MTSPGLRGKLLLILFGALLPLAVLELGLRVHHAYVRWRSPYEAAVNPGLVFVRKAYAGPGFNSLGFRDREHPLRKPAHLSRILVLGDSVTAGWGVPIEDMYTRRLEQLLNQRGRRYEVINLGVAQYSTVQEVVLFNQLGLARTPDLVIVGYVLNDPIRDGSINDFFERDPHRSLVASWMVRKARSLPGNRDPFRAREGCRFFDYYSWIHCDADRWAAVSDSLRELAELSRHHGFRLLLVIFPLLPEHSWDEYPWHDVHRQVLAEATRNGYSTLDLLPAFARRPPDELKIAPDDSLHPNALGNRIAADAIFEAVEELQ